MKPVTLIHLRQIVSVPSIVFCYSQTNYYLSVSTVSGVSLGWMISLSHGVQLFAVCWNKVIAINRKTNLTSPFHSAEAHVAHLVNWSRKVEEYEIGVREKRATDEFYIRYRCWNYSMNYFSLRFFFYFLSVCLWIFYEKYMRASAIYDFERKVYLFLVSYILSHRKNVDGAMCSSLSKLAPHPPSKKQLLFLSRECAPHSPRPLTPLHNNSIHAFVSYINSEWPTHSVALHRFIVRGAHSKYTHSTMLILNGKLYCWLIAFRANEWWNESESQHRAACAHIL